MGRLIMAEYVYDGGGVLSLDVKKRSFEKNAVKKTTGTLLGYKQVALSDNHFSLEDDGKPLENEFLKEQKLKEEKQKEKEQVMYENYKEEKYKEVHHDSLNGASNVPAFLQVKINSKGNY